MRQPANRRLELVQKRVTAVLRAAALASLWLLIASLPLLTACGGSRLSGSVDEKVRGAAALGVRDADDNVPVLLEAAQTEPEMVQVEAVVALGRIGTPKAVEALAKVAAHESRVVRVSVAQALSDVKAESYPGSAPVLVAMGQAAMPKGPADDPRLDERRAVTTALAVVQQKAGLDFLLDRAVHDTDENIRNAAVKTLGRLHDPRPVDALMEIYRNDTDKNRAWAIEALGEIGDAPAVPVIEEALSHNDKITRGKAAWSLMQIEREKSIPTLKAALAREDNELPAVRMAHALAKLGEKDAVINLEQYLLTARNEFARAEAGRALAEVGRCESLTAIDRAFREDRDGLVRKEAGAAARNLLDRCSPEAVKKALGARPS